ncbi:NAD(P)H-hydrate epimerase [Candidatus Berkelbacteria bacterium]|nr:NAD(P)H-hydrate epimerase [Candidatus Berkelbacteria bacterium]
MHLGAVSATQMDAILEQLGERLGLNTAATQENGAYAAAEQARRMLTTLDERAVVILVGPGGTGAIGAAVARRLASWGSSVTVLLGVERALLQPTTLQQLELAEACGVRVFDPGALLPPAELILDALVGLHGHGRLEGTLAQAVRLAVSVKVPILALDVPSGMDATSGKADQPVIRADVTVTLGYPKTGLVKPFSPVLVGQLLVADLGIPPQLWQHIGQPAPDFSAGPLVAVDLDSKVSEKD